MAYTRYTNAATLNNSERRVITFTYTWSHSFTNASMAANVARPRTTIPTVNMKAP
jgi:hypothetical protein